jgi:hypothetical protein
MTLVGRFNIGDELDVYMPAGGTTRTRIETDPNGGAPILVRVTYMCIGCNENEVDGRDGICPGCVMRAMRLVAIRDALNHVIATSPDVRAVVERDNLDVARARHSSMPYCDIRDAAHDQYVGATTSHVYDEVRLEMHAIVNAMVSGAAYATDPIV